MKSASVSTLFFYCIIGIGLCSSSQSYSQSYFQQKVDHNLSVLLDTSNQKLDVKSTVTYQNNSSDELEYIFFHAWWNCFSDNSSAFAEQQLELGSRAFYFAKDDERGGYEQLEFLDGSNTLVQEYYVEDGKKHTDIIKVWLDDPLASGETKEIAINFVSKIPKLFSRSGRSEDLYQFTQWYPKPAVYDSEGWHPMPYLDMGEFYSEYGDYKVELVLPSSYNCVATGMELDDRGSETLRKISYTAVNVPDFAWFTSDTYIKKESIVSLNDNKGIIPIKLFTNMNEDHDQVLTYMSDAVKFYSQEVGLYPYSQYTLVLNATNGSGGMEYPMISMVEMESVGQDMDNLIAHEIGHNWFQSAIGSDERTYPWMDEGLNSFYERKYNDSKYTEPNYNNLLPKFLKSKNPEYSTLQAGVCHLHCCGKLGKIDRPSDQVDMLNYGSNSYERMAFALRYLEAYLGADVFATAMKEFYSNWSHKHPGPEDLSQSFESSTGKELTWFLKT